KRNLLVPVNEQPETQINSSEQVLPFDQLFRLLISLINPDKAIGLQTLFDNYKRGEIGEHTFVPLMRGILGDQMLRSFTAKVKQRKRNLLVPVNKQPRTEINSGELVLPFDQLFPFLISHIDLDKGIELEVFFDKYKRGEIPKHTFESFMKRHFGGADAYISNSKTETTGR
ncbi:transcription initiation factor TFIID subunit 4b-like, partial [Trifolium medium]|nr:transcription initiation factor TFIID subunit 4b-like [Trifolium medium]